MLRKLTRRPAFGLAAGLVFALVITAAVAAAGTAPDQQLLSLFRTPNTQFPAVALRVDGQPVSGQYLAYAVKQVEENATAAGQTMTKAQAVQAVVDRLAAAAGLADEATRRGYTASDAEITTYLTRQTQAALATNPAGAAAVWAANGDADGNAYVNDPKVRALTARIIAGAKMLEAMRAADPSFNDQALGEQLRAGISVQLYFNP